MAAPRVIAMDHTGRGRDDCFLCVRTRCNVKYITIEGGTLDSNSLGMVLLRFQDILPEMPYDESYWNTGFVSRNAESGKLETALYMEEFPAVGTVWFHKKVDILQLQRTRKISLLAQECTINSDISMNDSPPENLGQNTMVAKIAQFHWEIQSIEAETRIYQLLQSARVGPRFLAHVHEEGRVIGFLLEKVEGRRAGIADLDICQRALQRLHNLGVLHGDVNRRNFIIVPGHEAVLIDFEKAVIEADVESLAKEMSSLGERLSEESGRGSVLWLNTRQGSSQR